MMNNTNNRIKSLQELGLSLTPMEIHDKEFKHSMRGYNELEVNEFLDEIIKDYDLFNSIVKDLQRQIIELKNNVPQNSSANLDSIMQRLREVEIHIWGRSKEY